MDKKIKCSAVVVFTQNKIGLHKTKNWHTGIGYCTLWLRLILLLVNVWKDHFIHVEIFDFFKRFASR